MTHSAHRQGTHAGLTDDFVALGFPSQSFPDLAQRLEKYREIGRRYGPVHLTGVHSILSPRHLVFDSLEKVQGVLKDLVPADLALSIIVSGLRDQVAECCRHAGIRPHTLCQSLGFWGKTSSLPHPAVLEITTMCGHGRIAPSLVWDYAQKVTSGNNAREAAREMAKLCLCNIFNPVRGARLLEKIARDIREGVLIPPQPVKIAAVAGKDYGITIDQSQCLRCKDCLSYCPVSAIVETADGSVRIDPDKCYECGVCRHSRACPVDAILGLDLPWPRNLRGKFQSLYAPYHHAPELVPAAPVKYSDEVKVISRHEAPSELYNDVDGMLKPGETEVIAELGRPHLGATFRDIQKLIQALMPLGLNPARQYPVLDERRPVTDLMTDPVKGIFRPDVLDEKAGWIMLKLVVPDKSVPGVLRRLQQVAGEIDTVFAVDVLTCVTNSAMTMADKLAGEIGVQPACNCKTNVGLGRLLSKIY